MASGYLTGQCSEKFKNICPKIWAQEYSFQDCLKYMKQKTTQIVIHNKMNKLQHMHEVEYCTILKNK